MGWFGHPIFPHGVAGHPSSAMGGCRSQPQGLVGGGRPPPGAKKKTKTMAKLRLLLVVVNHRRATGNHFLELEHHLLVWNHHEVLCDCEVMNHGRHQEWNLNVGRFLPVRREFEVLEVRLLRSIISTRETEEMKRYNCK
jgi:hypothetical protein